MRTIFRFLYVLAISTLLYSCALLSAAGISSQGQPTKEVPKNLESTTAGSSVNIDHSDWDALLKKHVNDKGFVDYKGFTNDSSKLEDYTKKLGKYEPTNDWSVQELLAYYINLYNAHTVKLIIEHPNIKSIKDIDGPWTKAIVPVGNKMLSLGGIENGILRKMNEPRIHFAINCASISCPNLLKDAYTASKINEQLEQATTAFINSSKNDISKNSATVSSIFDWYKKDYIVHEYTSVIDFINAYSDVQIDSNTILQYKNYDWNLNSQK